MLVDLIFDAECIVTKSNGNWMTISVENNDFIWVKIYCKFYYHSICGCNRRLKYKPILIYYICNFYKSLYDMNMLRLNLCRSCRQRCSVRKGVLRNFTKFTGRHLRQSLYFNKDFIKIETLAQVFSCEFCKISKNIFFTEYVWATASTFDCYWTFFLLPSWLIHISFKYPSQFSGLRRVRSPTDSCQT